MIRDVEDFFVDGCGRCARFATPDCSARRWKRGLIRLRQICRAAGLTETVKWGHPCYIHAGRNIALLGAFRDNFRISFMNAALLHDVDGVLERSGPNTAHPNTIRFTSEGQVEALEPTLRAYLSRAMDCAEAGTAPPRSAPELDLPDALAAALDDDPDLADAFHRLTPGRQRSYAIALNSAKKPETRLARIARFRGRIFAGKGANER